jgi:hypothetical protein
MGETGEQSFQRPAAPRAMLTGSRLPLLFRKCFDMKAELLDDFRKLEFGYI